MRVEHGGRWEFLRTRVVVLVATVAVLATGCLGSIGDRYFPNYGNAGYDVHHYDLAVTYDPNTDVLQGVATITAKAQFDLTHFHLDLVGLTVHGVTVDGKPAPFSRDDHELVIDPRTKIGQGRIFTVIVDYSGVPTVLDGGGFYTTNDGALAVGEPEVATTWYPVNDHPLDKATYTFPRDDTERVRRRRERCAPRADPGAAGLDHADLGSARTDGQLSGDDRHRHVGHP